MGRRSIVWPPVLEGGRLPYTPDPEDPSVPDSERDDELWQVIALSLLPYVSDNPFNERGLGTADQTWRAIDRATEGRIRTRIKERFRQLEATRRARLVDVVFSRPAPGQLVAAIEYLSLETSRQARQEIRLV